MIPDARKRGKCHQNAGLPLRSPAVEMEWAPNIGITASHGIPSPRSGHPLCNPTFASFAVLRAHFPSPSCPCGSPPDTMKQLSLTPHPTAPGDGGACSCGMHTGGDGQDLVPLFRGFHASPEGVSRVCVPTTKSGYPVMVVPRPISSSGARPPFPRPVSMLEVPAPPPLPGKRKKGLPEGGRAFGGDGGGAHQGQTSREGEKDIWWAAGTARGGTGHLGLTHTETQRGRLRTACGQRRVDSKNSQTTPATTNTSSIRQLLGAAMRHTMPHPAQPQHTYYGAPQTRQRHQPEHRPQRPTERSDPTQHAKGRTGDCPGPRKGITTQRNVTQGGSRDRARIQGQPDDQSRLGHRAERNNFPMVHPSQITGASWGSF